MRIVNMLLTAGAAAVSLATAAPVAAQYYPPAYPGYPPAAASPGYGGYGGYGAYGYAPNGYDQGYITNSCVNAVQARLNGNYGYGYGYEGGRVLGVTTIEPPGNGNGWRVWGVASGSSYEGPDITWSCRTDFRGVVVDVDLKRGYSGNNSRPWGDDYEPYGYHRY